MTNPESANFAPKSSPKKRLKTFLLFFAFIVLNIVVIAITAVNEFGNSKTAAELSEVKLKWGYLLPAALMFIIAIFLNICEYVLMFRKLVPKDTLAYKKPWIVARRNVLLGRYYDNITPAAVGGQPFQIYYLHKTGELSTGQATAIPIFGMISLQIAFIVIAIFCFILGGLSNSNPALIVTAWIGLLVNAFWPTLTFLSIISEKITTKILKFFVNFLAKIKIVKNRDAAFKKVEAEVKEYATSVKLILKKPKIFSIVMILAFLFNFLISAIPFFVLTAFGGDVDFVQCFVLTVAVQSAVYFIPTPGNSGAAEGTFYLVFSALSTGYVFWAMLVWRFFSYYIYIIMGLLVYFSRYLTKKRQNNKKVI